ncbi:MAG: transposase [Lentisphaerales bacterium]|nr:transposase [Lentisphaerales bacterium]
MFRANSHHCLTEVLIYLDEHEIACVIGLSKKYLPRDIYGEIGKRVRMLSKLQFKKVGLFHSFQHSVSSWNRQHRFICRAEGNGSEADLRYIATNLTDKTQFLYAKVYCDRANAELRIKDSKLELNSDRTSCHGKEANQFRLLLNAVAYQIMHAFRANIPKGTQWAKCTFKTIQLRILKTSARLEVKKTFIRLHMPKSCTAKQVFNRFAKISQSLNKT